MARLVAHVSVLTLRVPARSLVARRVAVPLVTAIVEAHSYTNPAVVVWPIKALPGIYGDWVEDSVR